MDELELRGKWHELKGKVKEAHGDLTDDDLRWEEGKDEEFYGLMQKKLGKSREQVVDWLRSRYGLHCACEFYVPPPSTPPTRSPR